MKIIPQLPPYAPAFGYNSVIKTLWLKGQLPTVKKGLYGIPLTKKTISNEHLEPYCISKDNSLKNMALANKYINNLRGCKPLKDFITYEQAEAYYMQFKGIKYKNFDGDEYIKEGLETLNRLDIRRK